MKNKFLFAVAVFVAAAVGGGLASYGVLRLAQGGVSNHSKDHSGGGVSVNDEFAGGNHFTAFSADGYPDLTYAAENAVKAVVSVIKTEQIPERSFGGGNPFFEFFGIPPGYYENQPDGGDADSNGNRNDGEPRYRERATGSGSGVVVSPDGYIVTNHHVVAGASKLTVKLPDGKTYDAKLIGTDADTEIALIKVEAADLPSIPFGDSDALRLGEWVLAIGNPYDLHSTVTAGIVSAKSRSLGAIQTSGNAGIESFIQTDAAVNPGNSGGALVNVRGELVGINTLIKSPTGSYAGYAFAVPETIVRKVVADIREFGVVQRAVIGVTYTVIDDRFVREEGEEKDITEPGGVYVREVQEDGAAEAAGIKEGDVLTEIDGEAITGSATIAGVVGRKRPGDTVEIVARRGNNMKHFDVLLRNRAGKSELVARETFDAIESLGGEFAEVRLSDRQRRELDIRGGIQVASVEQGGILARAGVKRGYIITHINGRAIASVGDLYRLTDKITTIEGTYPDGRAVTYSLVE
jgi:Do/DeqQ family serine protease